MKIVGISMYSDVSEKFYLLFKLHVHMNYCNISLIPRHSIDSGGPPSMAGHVTCIKFYWLLWFAIGDILSIIYPYACLYLQAIGLYVVMLVDVF